MTLFEDRRFLFVNPATAVFSIAFTAMLLSALLRQFGVGQRRGPRGVRAVRRAPRGDRPKHARAEERGTPTLVLLLATTLAGCSTTTLPIPPDMQAVGTSFRQSHATEADALDAATWRGFADPVLDDLIAQTRAANLDVRIAQQRVRQARAGSTAAASRSWPTVALTASVSDQRTGMPDEVRRGLPDTRAIRGALDIGWEVDVAGAARAAADAAELDALAADAGVQAAQWLASTEVARQYIVGQGARLRLQQLQALLLAQVDTERLTRSRETGGLASRFDVSRAAGEVQSLTAQLPPVLA